MSYNSDMQPPSSLEPSRQELDLEVLSKGFLDDARGVLRRLENPAPLDESLQIRIHAMTRELQDDVGELTASRESPEFSSAMALPLRDLAQAVLDTSDVDTTVARDRIALALLAVIQTIEADAEGPHIWARMETPQLAGWLLRQLDLTHEMLADWLGVSSRTIQRWLSGEASPAAEQTARLRALARIVAQLRFIYPPRGIVQFLQRPIAPWGGRTTIAILDDEELVRQAEAAAKGIRG